MALTKLLVARWMHRVMETIVVAVAVANDQKPHV